MIRRHLRDRFFLFTQHDHALLAGRMAEQCGNARFARPEPRDEVVRSAGLHDCGWPTHDDAPTLNEQRLPADFMESSVALATGVWAATTDRVSTEAPYTQLLVSLHVLNLSGLLASRAKTRHETFALNQFQQREVERQVALRKQLGLSTDIPLRLGLADKSADSMEEQLRRNHLLVQTMDRISLALLTTTLAFPRIENILPRPGAAPVGLTFTRTAEFAVRVDPWPFECGRMEFQVPYRSLPAHPYTGQEAFREAYRSAVVHRASVVVHS